jgi:hypothetical protein
MKHIALLKISNKWYVVGNCKAQLNNSRNVEEDTEQVLEKANNKQLN